MLKKAVLAKPEQVHLRLRLDSLEEPLSAEPGLNLTVSVVKIEIEMDIATFTGVIIYFFI